MCRFILYAFSCLDGLGPEYSTEMAREDLKKDMLKLRKHVGNVEQWLPAPMYKKVMDIVWGH